MVRHTLHALGPKVLAARMVRDYVETLYLPAARASANVSARDYAGARGLAAWRSRVASHWRDITVAHVESSGVGDTPELGATLSLRAEVVLGAAIRADDVAVQACYGTVDEHDVLHDVGCVPMLPIENGADRYRYEADLPLQQAGPFGYTVRVLPHHELLSIPAELGLVTSA
jgi:starch phosphorylase